MFFIKSVRLGCITAFLTVFSTSALFGIDVVRIHERLVLRDDCNKIEANRSSLAQWSQTLGSKRICNQEPLPLSNRKNDSDCELDITDCVPEHVRKYHGLSPKLSGPNCWNLSLVMSSLLPFMRYSTLEEMAFFMRSPLCRNLTERRTHKSADCY